jgi:hypothetical protein
MNTEDLCIGDRVKFAHEEELAEVDRGDRGKVLGFSDAWHREALIAWDSGVRTWSSVVDLAPTVRAEP